MRIRPSYANVAATLALVLAMSGGAFAAGHYLINSTRQINPKVLKKLKGARGPVGATGPQGPKGAGGPAGKNGTPGKEGAPGTPASASLATSFVQDSFSPKLLVSGSVLTLSTKTSGGGKNLVLTTTGARVLAQATIEAISEASTATVSCNFAAQGFAGGEPVSFGQASKVSIPGGEREAEIPLTANVPLVGPETYDLQVYCETVGPGLASVVGGSLNAVGYE